MKKLLSLMLAMLLTASVYAVSVHAAPTPLAAGNSKSSASLIPSYDVDYLSSLSYAKEEDWFKFQTVSNSAYYTFTLTNDSIATGSFSYEKLYLFLYSAVDKELCYTASSCYNSASCDILLETNTTYYIKVCAASGISSNTGNYEIRLSYKPDNVPNSKSEAVPISLNTVYNSSLDGTNDVDWYKFTAPATSKYTFKILNNSVVTGSFEYEKLNMFVYNSVDKELACLKVSLYNSTEITLDLEKNSVYYFKVLAAIPQNTGNYEFEIHTDALIPPKKLQSIAIVQQPSKTTYKVGESLNTAGMVVRAAYDDGSTSDLTDYDVSGYNAYQTGTQTITVCATVNGTTKTATFTVIVRDSTVSVALSSISLDSKPAKTSYTVGESFDASGISVRAKYSDGTSRIVETYTISDVDTSTAGIKTVTVTYTEDGVTQTCNFTVTVKQKIDFGKILSTLEKVLKALQAPAIQLLNLFLSIIKIIFG